MGKPRLSLFLAAALATLLLAVPPAAAQEQSAAYSGLVGVGAGLCTLVYTPLKVAYAVGGTAVGTLGWIWTLGDRDVAGPVFRSSLYGDYVVTPAHLEGRRRLRFIGT